MNRFYNFSTLFFLFSVVASAQNLKRIPSALINENFLRTFSDASLNNHKIEKEAERRKTSYSTLFSLREKSYPLMIREHRNRIKVLLLKILDAIVSLSPTWMDLTQNPETELAELLAMETLPEIEQTSNLWSLDDWDSSSLIPIQKRVQSQDLSVPGLLMLPNLETSGSPTQPRVSDGSSVSLENHFGPIGPERSSTGSSAASVNFRTPVAFSVALRPIEKLRRAVSNAIAIMKETRNIRRKGLLPLILHESSWIELCSSSHYFISDNEGASAVGHWKLSGGDSFHEECRIGGTRLYDWSRTASSVQYLQPKQREQYRVRICLLEPGVTVLLTANGFLLRSRRLIFVMGSEGELYLAEPQLGLFHHSSIFSGGAVVWAGELKTNENGEISYLSNESGHYKPQRIHNFNGLRQLKRQGIDLNKVIFQEFSKDSVMCEEPKYNALKYLASENFEFDS